MEQRLLEEPPSPRLVDRVRVFNRQALAEVFDGSFDELYLYIHALVADHDTAERVAEDTFGRVLDRLPDYTGEPAGLKAWVLHHGADAVRRVPRGALAGKGLREAVARLTRFEHEAVTLRLVAGLDAPTAALATGRRTSSILGAVITGLRALRSGSATLNPLSLPTQQRQLDAALDRLLAGGAQVAVLDRDVAGSSPSALAVTADVTDDAAVRSAFAAAVAAHGGLDIVFANAGIAAVPGGLRCHAGRPLLRACASPAGAL